MRKYMMKKLYAVMKIVWKVTKPRTTGVRLLLIKDGKVLLVKHTYQNSWYLPGGGVKKGETFEEAAKREFLEELGGSIKEFKLFGVYNNFYESKNDTIVVFLCSDFEFTGKTDSEIESFQLFNMESLPEKISPGSRKRLDEYKEKSYPSVGMW